MVLESQSVCSHQPSVAIKSDEEYNNFQEVPLGGQGGNCEAQKPWALVEVLPRAGND